MNTNYRNAYLGKLISCLFAAFFMATLSATALAEKINLNSADVETLQYIPGIGPAKSQDIVDLRTASNGFKTMEELLAVPGIGASTLETIRQHGALDSGVSQLTEEMKNNPPKSSTSTSG
jgi:competence ComEA-like helix-hairpin-helix protein